VEGVEGGKLGIIKKILKKRKQKMYKETGNLKREGEEGMFGIDNPSRGRGFEGDGTISKKPKPDVGGLRNNNWL